MTRAQAAGMRLVLPWLALAVSVAAAEVPAEGVGEVLVTRQLMEARGLAVGDVVRLSTDAAGAGARPFRVVGHYEPTPDPFRLADRRLELRMHLPDLIAMTAEPGDLIASESVDQINLALAPPVDVPAFSRDLAARMPGLVVAPPLRSAGGTDPFLVLERFHKAIAAVTVVGSTAFLLALMIMRAEERRETAGILRLIGFTRPGILLEGFLEGLVIAGLGAVIGILIALALGPPFNRFFQWRYDTALVFVRVTPRIALTCVAVAVPLGIVAGLLASWTLLRRSILSLLRR